MIQPLLRLEDVTIQYGKPSHGHLVLTDVDFSLAQQDWVTITGPSGIGKSSLLHIMAGLIPPSKGHVYYEGKELKRDKDRAMYRNQQIGMIFQGSQLHPALSVWENVALPSRLIHFRRSRFTEEERKRAAELLKIVGLEDKMDALPHQLSLGQRRRVAIARALMNQPKLLLADEPTNDLDLHLVEQVLEVFQEIHQSGVAIVLVTHQPLTSTYGTRHIQIRDGKLIERVLQ